ncbi:MAG: hypothetical protein QOH79_1007 [Acidimicrobiaceae bacterium]
MAYHSGVSWSAIAQIESGRRKDVRLSSLTALADALQLSVDHLVGSTAAISPKPLGHCLHIYESDEEFVGAAGGFIREGIERSECVLAVMTKRQTDLIHDALGDAARSVEFKNTSEWYRSPSETLDAYREFVNEQLAGGAHWIRIVGEACWTGYSRAKVDGWMRYESMVNLSFASAPATLLCLYDARSAPENVLADARRTHPELAHAAECGPSPDFRRAEDFLLVPGQLRRPV